MIQGAYHLHGHLGLAMDSTEPEGVLHSAQVGGVLTIGCCQLWDLGVMASVMS